MKEPAGLLGVRRDLAELLEAVANHCRQQRLLGGEVPVERRGRDARALDHLVHTHGADSALREQFV